MGDVVVGSSHVGCTGGGGGVHSAPGGGELPVSMMLS